MFCSVSHADAIRCRCSNKSCQKLRWLANIFGERHSQRLLTSIMKYYLLTLKTDPSWRGFWGLRLSDRLAFLCGGRWFDSKLGIQAKHWLRSLTYPIYQYWRSYWKKSGLAKVMTAASRKLGQMSIMIKHLESFWCCGSVLTVLTLWRGCCKLHQQCWFLVMCVCNNFSHLPPAWWNTCHVQQF